MTISEALKVAQEQLSGFENPQMEARELLQAMLKLSSAELITREELQLNEKSQNNLRNWLRLRATGVPLAYLSGVKGFYKEEFDVEPGVLVPRPETELVVETALKRKPMVVKRLADFGSGSGCIGLSLLKEIPEATLFAIDSSRLANDVTEKNARKLKLENRVEIVSGPVEQWIPEQPCGMIVANPPYIAKDDPSVQKSVHDHEPHEALYADNEGLAAIHVWTLTAHSCLRPGGVFVCEIGAGQSAKAMEIMKKAGFKDIQVAKDLAGIERVVSGVRNG